MGLRIRLSVLFVSVVLLTFPLLFYYVSQTKRTVLRPQNTSLPQQVNHSAARWHASTTLKVPPKQKVITPPTEPSNAKVSILTARSDATRQAKASTVKAPSKATRREEARIAKSHSNATRQAKASLGKAPLNATRRAYVLLVDKNALECPARVAASRLRELDNSTDVVVMALRAFSGSVPQATKIVTVPSPKTVGNPRWFNTFAKFHAVNLGYDEVMFFDLDVVFLRSPAHWFDSTSKEVGVPPAYWLRQPFLMSGGPMIFRPSPSLSRRVDKVLSGHGGHFASEMDWFNREFRDAERIEDFATLLCGEFIAGDGIYKHFERRRKLKTPQQVLAQATLVHFIADWKPWLPQVRHAAAESPPLRSVLDIWDAGKDRECCSGDRISRHAGHLCNQPKQPKRPDGKTRAVQPTKVAKKEGELVTKTGPQRSDGVFPRRQTVSAAAVAASGPRDLPRFESHSEIKKLPQGK